MSSNYFIEFYFFLIKTHHLNLNSYDFIKQMNILCTPSSFQSNPQLNKASEVVCCYISYFILNKNKLPCDIHAQNLNIKKFLLDISFIILIIMLCADMPIKTVRK